MKLKHVSLFILAVGLFHFSCSHIEPMSDAQFAQIKSVYKNGDYFELRKALAGVNKMDRPELFYYNAVVSTAFNQIAESNEYIEKMMTTRSIVSDSLMADALQLKVNNLVRMGKYKEANLATSELIEGYAHSLDSASEASSMNSNKIWKSLSSIDPMEVEATAYTSVSLTKDKAGLDRIPLTIGGTEVSFVLDTGANFSTIQRSYAEQLGMQIFDANFDVRGFGGKYVPSDVAVANRIEIGNHVITNVIFLVFEDEMLTFPQADFKIEGIIGFPVIDEVGEVRINRKKERLEIPEKAELYSTNNLAMDGFIPLVQIEAYGELLLCYFDTGATDTDFFDVYYKKHKERIHNRGYERTSLLATGAGGSTEIEGYIIPEFDLRIGDNDVTLNNVSLYAESLTQNETRFANIGQDVINQFDVLIMNFRSMSLLFE